MKYYISTLLIICSGIIVNAQERLLIDKVVCKVGTETILLSDVESQYSYAADQTAGLNPNLKCEIFQSIIGQKLIIHHAKLDSVIVSDDELEANLNFRIDGVLRQMNGDEALFEEYYDMTVNEMRDNLREDLEHQMLAERMQGKIINEVEITPKEVKEFFRSIPFDSIPYLNAEVEISEIVVKPEVNEDERIKALDKVSDIRKKIVEGGEDFGELAIKHSDDPGSGSRGGDLGFAERGTYVQDFEATAYALEENEISDPVETEFGFHIIQMIKRAGTKIKLRHILIKPTITDDDKSKAQIKLDTIKAQIERAEITFSQAVKKYSFEDVPSYHNNGSIQNPNTGKTTFETAELPTEIYFAIEEMDVNDVSTSLEYPLPTGEVYYRIIQLQSKTRPHKASLEMDYTKILNYAKESKKNEYFSAWLEEKLKDTYIDIDRNFLNCPDLDKFIQGGE